MRKIAESVIEQLGSECNDNTNMQFN